MIPVGYIRECFQYREDGRLVWLERPAHHFKSAVQRIATNARYAGKEVGNRNIHGYWTAGLSFNGKKHRLILSRVIWAMHNDHWPVTHIDHINRVRDDNRIENLREATPELNAANRPNRHVGPVGVYPSRKKKGGFVAQINVSRRVIHLGTFATEDEASRAFEHARIQRASRIEATRA